MATRLKFAQVVKRWRKSRKLTKVAAARELGVPYRTFQSWEYGEREPRGIYRFLLLHRLGAFDGLIPDRKSGGLSRRAFRKLLNAKFDFPTVAPSGKARRL